MKPLLIDTTTASPAQQRAIDAYNEDVELGSLIEEWHATWGRLDIIYSGDGSRDGVSDLLDKLSAIEERIVRLAPVSYTGARAMLEMATEIIADRMADPHGIKGRGPAHALVINVLCAMDNGQGLLGTSVSGD